jgi:hypothetical protein
MRWLVLFFAMASPLLAGEWKSLFDGQSLQGWVPRGQARFEVQEGAIVGTTGSGGFGWLCTDRTYGDFVLELEVKAEAGNSGIQIRSHFGREMVGYQVEIDPSDRRWSGGLYEQGRRGWLQDLRQQEEARKAFRKGEWNQYRIECVGDRIRSWVNGVPAADYIDSMDLEGLIALQVHSGRNVRVQMRNVRIQDLGRHVWKPLWNGKDFTGWSQIGKGRWEVVEGAIRGLQRAEEKEYGHLITDQEFTNLTVRVQYKAVAGNSGLYFRVAPSGFSGVTGFQAEIDAHQDAGGLYETNGRGWVVRPAAAEVNRWFRKGDWNTMTVSAHGRRVAVDVNGHRTAELREDAGRTSGHLALQVHGGQEVEVWFRSVDLLVREAP